MSVQVILILLGAVLTVLGTIIVSQFKSLREDIKVMSSSLTDLTTKMATIINDQTWHKKETEELERRISILEVSLHSVKETVLTHIAGQNDNFGKREQDTTL